MTRGKRSQLQRRVVLLGLALAGVAPALRAQQAGQFEVGAFGSYTRYDKAFGLDNRAGGGARLGYFFGKVVGLEAEVLFQPNYTVSTGGARSEEHTSELQSHSDLVCRLLLEKKKKKKQTK